MKECVPIALYSAAVGAVLALIGGIFGGVDFASIIFRMTVSAAISVVLAVCGALIIRKFLPELWLLNSAESAPITETAPVTETDTAAEIIEPVDAEQSDKPTREHVELSELSEEPAGEDSVSGTGNEVDPRKFALAIQTMLNKE